MNRRPSRARPRPENDYEYLRRSLEEMGLSSAKDVHDFYRRNASVVQTGFPKDALEAAERGRREMRDVSDRLWDREFARLAAEGDSKDLAVTYLSRLLSTMSRMGQVLRHRADMSVMTRDLLMGQIKTVKDRREAWGSAIKALRADKKDIESAIDDVESGVYEAESLAEEERIRELRRASRSTRRYQS